MFGSVDILRFRDVMLMPKRSAGKRSRSIPIPANAPSAANEAGEKLVLAETEALRGYGSFREGVSGRKTARVRALAESAARCAGWDI